MFSLPPINQEPREVRDNFPKNNIQLVKSGKMNVDRQETSAASSGTRAFIWSPWADIRLEFWALFLVADTDL